MRFFRKKNFVDAWFVDLSKPELWPAKVALNAASPTGLAYGSLAETEADLGVGWVRVDGIPLQDKTWLVIDNNGTPENLTDEDFQKFFIIEKE
jgi:hypothetical protein